MSEGCEERKKCVEREREREGGSERTRELTKMHAAVAHIGTLVVTTSSNQLKSWIDCQINSSWIKKREEDVRQMCLQSYRDSQVSVGHQDLPEQRFTNRNS